MSDNESREDDERYYDYLERLERDKQRDWPWDIPNDIARDGEVE